MTKWDKFGIIFLFLLTGAIVAILYRREHKPQFPILAETSETVLYRVYFDTPAGSRYFLYNRNNEMCEVDQNDYLLANVGDSFTCPWRQQ